MAQPGTCGVVDPLMSTITHNRGHLPSAEEKVTRADCHCAIWTRLGGEQISECRVLMYTMNVGREKMPMIKTKDRIIVLHSFAIMIRDPRLDRGVGMFVAWLVAWLADWLAGWLQKFPKEIVLRKKWIYNKRLINTRFCECGFKSFQQISEAFSQGVLSYHIFHTLSFVLANDFSMYLDEFVVNQ